MLRLAALLPALLAALPQDPPRSDAKSLWTRPLADLGRSIALAAPNLLIVDGRCQEDDDDVEVVALRAKDGSRAWGLRRAPVGGAVVGGDSAWFVLDNGEGEPRNRVHRVRLKDGDDTPLGGLTSERVDGDLAAGEGGCAVLLEEGVLRVEYGPKPDDDRDLKVRKRWSSFAVGEGWVAYIDPDQRLACEPVAEDKGWRTEEKWPIFSVVAISGGRVFALDDQGHLFARELATGKDVWKQSPQILAIVLGKKLFASAVVSDGVLLLKLDQDDFHAFDAKTGARLWNRQIPHASDFYDRHSAVAGFLALRDAKGAQLVDLRSGADAGRIDCAGVEALAGSGRTLYLVTQEAIRAYEISRR